MPKEKKLRPPQHQKRQPGLEFKMRPQPKSGASDYVGCGKLRDKVALITGGDSGIGRAVAVLFAKEGADVAIVYFNEHKDATGDEAPRGESGTQMPAHRGRHWPREILPVGGEAGETRSWGKIDILVNNAAEQHPQESITKITERQLEKTFRTNIFAMFFLTKAVMPHFQERRRDH